MSLHGRLALVTGGASGIGKATCHVLAAQGARIVVAYLNLDAANVVAAELLDPEELTHILKMAEPKGKITRWIGKLEQFELEVNRRPVASLNDADALFRLEVVPHSRSYLESPALPLSTKWGTHRVTLLDVSDTDLVNRLFADIKDTESVPISIVVNCAGITKRSLLVDTTDEDFDKIIQVNLKGTFLVTRAAARAMITSGVTEGVIVNIASILGKSGLSGLVAYTASKGAVVALTKTVAKELAQHGIRCNAVLPSLTQTPMIFALREEPKRACIEQTPLRRVCQPEEVAEAILFLCSPNSSFVTGATLEVTGGFRM